MMINNATLRCDVIWNCTKFVPI